MSANLTHSCREGRMDTLSTCIELCSALFQGDHSALHTLLDNGAPVDVMPGYYPIHYAVNGGNIKCLEMLLNQPGIDVNRQIQNTGDTALHLAVRFQKNAKEICELLVSHGADVSVLNAGKETAFELALGWKNAPAELYGLLLNEKVMSAESDLHHIASRRGNVKGLMVLLNLEEQCSVVRLSQEDRRLLIRYAVVEGDLEILGLLCSHYRSEMMSSDLGDSLLGKCSEFAEGSSPDTLIYLIGQGCTSVVCDSAVKKWSCSAINETVWSSDQEVFDRLLSGIDPEKVSSFNSAVKSPIYRVLPYNYEFTYLNPLVMAATQQEWDCLVKLLDVGFDPNVPLVKHDWRFYLYGSAQRYVWHSQVAQNLVFWVQNNIFSSGTGVHNLLSRAILEIYAIQSYCETNEITDCSVLSEKQKKGICQLIRDGMKVNSAWSNEMSPLVALVCSCYNKSHLELYWTLIVEAGGYLDYRSKCSPFLSSDLAIAAAISGCAFILSELMSLLPQQAVMDLLLDLTNFSLDIGRVPDPDEQFGWRWNRWMVHWNVARSVQTLLSFASKSVGLLDVVGTVNEHFTVTGDQEDPDLKEADLAKIIECQQIWEIIHENFQQVDSLQHMCRLVISDSLKNGCSTSGSDSAQFSPSSGSQASPSHGCICQSSPLSGCASQSSPSYGSDSQSGSSPGCASQPSSSPGCVSQSSPSHGYSSAQSCSVSGFDFAQSVDQLPLPRLLKDMVAFKDVVNWKRPAGIQICPHENTAPTALDIGDSESEGEYDSHDSD